MQWPNQQSTRPEWPTEIANRADKEAIAAELAARAQDGDTIGVGSGSSAFLALLALAERVRREGLSIGCVPTSIEMESYCVQAGLPVTTLLNARPDWCFDGADEVDPNRNLIKGRGGAFHREKLVYQASPVRLLLVDESKFVPRLGVKFGVPLGVVPEAANLVRDQLAAKLGTEPQVRPAGGKDGGVITEDGALVMDLAIDERFSPEEYNVILCTTVGITSHGLFVGMNPEVVS